jgi:hypothetical protein
VERFDHDLSPEELRRVVRAKVEQSAVGARLIFVGSWVVPWCSLIIIDLQKVSLGKRKEMFPNVQK